MVPVYRSVRIFENTAMFDIEITGSSSFRRATWITRYDETRPDQRKCRYKTHSALFIKLLPPVNVSTVKRVYTSISTSTWYYTAYHRKF